MIQDPGPWPAVLGEFETIAMVEQGWSISRYGDGEIGLIDGRGYPGQEPSAALSAELRAILTAPAARCLPCIPTMDQKSPRYATWPQYAARYRRVLDLHRVYGSAFIGCRAKCPWIDTAEYVRRLRALPVGKRAIALAPADIVAADLRPIIPALAAVIECPKTQAYDVIDQLERDCVAAAPELVLITGGVMATCLANRLAARGIQGVDWGRAVGLLGLHREAA